MMHRPSVSVIVPNYNHAAFLPQRLESIFQQTVQEFEVILLDDCSTDQSREVLESYRAHPKVSHVVLNETNSGSPFLQWRKGVSLASGDYIWIAESDDWADLRFLETLLPLLESDPQTGLAYCHSVVTDEHGTPSWDIREWLADLDGDRWHSPFHHAGPEEVGTYLIHKNSIPNASAVVFRKKLFPAESPAFQMRLKGDWVIWAGILSASDVRYTSEPLNFFRSSPGNTRKQEDFSKRLAGLKEELLAVRWISTQVPIAAGVLKERYTYCFRTWFRSNQGSGRAMLFPLLPLIHGQSIRPLLSAILTEKKCFVMAARLRLWHLKQRFLSRGDRNG